MKLLERDAILGDLHGLLQQARAGHGSLVLLGGEAGVGKTTLLRRFLAEIRADAVCLIGHCDVLTTPRPLGPLFDVAAADAGLDRLLRDDAPRDLLFRTTLARLASGTRPTVLAVEDAHWADEATLDLIRYLGRRVDASHGLVVVTYRDDEIGRDHPLRRLLGDLATTAAVHRLEVRPLTAAGIAALAAGSGLDATELYARTRGNPFYATEVLAAIGEIPATVRDAVLARIARLPAGARSMLEAAAVLDSPVAHTLFEAMAAPAPDDLEAALAIGILRVEDDGHAYLFRHELAREAVLSAIPPLRRRILHARALRLLERAPVELRDPTRLAEHAEAAGNEGAVLAYAPEAARRAARLGAHREAVEQYERALRFAATLPAPDRALLLEALARECYVTAQIDRAVAAQRAALDLWRELEEPVGEGRNRCFAASLLWAQARVADADREAEAAVALMESIDAPGELALAYGTLAGLRGTTRADGEAIRLGERAIAQAERCGARDTMFDSLMTVGEVRMVQGETAAGQALIERAIGMSVDAGYDALTARGHLCLGNGFAESADFPRAIRHFEEGVRFSADRDIRLAMNHATVLLAQCHLRVGSWDTAGQLARSVLDSTAVAPGTRLPALVTMGLLLTRRGEAGAWALLDEALTLAAASESVRLIAAARAARAEARFLAGDAEGARDEATAGGEIAESWSRDWQAGELAYWRWKTGAATGAPAGIRAPFVQHIAGDWEAAAAAWDALECPYEAARARCEGMAEPVLLSALAAFERLDARPMAAMVRRRLRRLGVRGVPRGPRQSTRGNPAGLTRRQVDILRLLMAGKSNQEIATRLFLSPRTVENHVAAILAKLGAATRGEAAEVARQAGINPQAE
jgi:DNA-binding CsgD family transcriptional regulator